MKKIRKMKMLLGLMVIVFLSVGMVWWKIKEKENNLATAEGPAGGIKMEILPQENQLIASVETLQEAELIAKLYGITLVKYNLKVATYHTDQDPQLLIQLGEEKGYPTLSLNYSYPVQ